MGMFDKDKLFAPDGKMRDWAELDSPFILWDIGYKGEVETPDGPTDSAPIVWLTVSTQASPDTKNTVSMIGDIIKEKAEALEPGELPALCVVKEVDSSIPGGNRAFVLNYYGDYKPSAKAKA